MNQTKTPLEKLLLYLGIGLAAVLVAVAIAALVFLINTGSAMLSHFTPTEPEPTAPPLLKNTYGPEDFALQDGYMTCLASDYMLGIDVSQWNGEIDWAAVKSAGIQFVFIRAGGRGWGEEGTLYSDSMAQAYYEGAKEQGLLIGAYFFSQAITTQEAREEARYALQLVSSWELDLPLVIDWEYVGEDARTAGISRRQLTDCILSFCQTVEENGRKPMFYTGWEFYENWMYPQELTDLPMWLAMYSTSMEFPYRFTLWQYTGSGSVPGISTDVDMNIMPIS